MTGQEFLEKVLASYEEAFEMKKSSFAGNPCTGTFVQRRNASLM